MPSNRFNPARGVTWAAALGALVLVILVAAAAAGRASASTLCGNQCGGSSEACFATTTWETYGTAGTSSFYIGYISVITCNVNDVRVTGSACNQEWIPEGTSGQWQDLKASCDTLADPGAVLQLANTDHASLSGRVQCTPVDTTQKFRANVGWYAEFPDGGTQVVTANNGPHSYNCIAYAF